MVGLELMAWAQAQLRLMAGRAGDGGMAAAERALTLNPGLAEAHAAKVRVLTADAIETALQLDAESYEVNFAAGRWCVATRDHRQAIAFYEKAASEITSDFYAAGMLPTCYLVRSVPRQVKTLLQHVAEANQIALDNKVLGIGMASEDIPLEPGR
jgi:hypothetical protein